MVNCLSHIASAPLMIVLNVAFGFLAGEEVKAAGVGNLGLQDREYLSHPAYDVYPTQTNTP